MIGYFSTIRKKSHAHGKPCLAQLRMIELPKIGVRGILVNLSLKMLIIKYETWNNIVLKLS